jgi:hypothetical protein
LWAGVNPAAGFGKWTTSWNYNLDANLIGLPFSIWCGELDRRMIIGGKNFEQRLRLLGNPVHSH